VPKVEIERAFQMVSEIAPKRRRFAIPRRLSAATVLNLLEQTKERLNGLVCALALIKGTN